MASSVYISKQYEYVDKILRSRKRKRIRTSFFLSFFSHFFIFLVLSLGFKAPFKEKSISLTETYVQFADYKPLEKTINKTDEVVDNLVKRTNKEADDVEPKKDKVDSENKVSLFKKPNNFSWREEVSKKYIKEDIKVVTPKIKNFNISPAKQPQTGEMSPQLGWYIRAFSITVKSHWQIPEDIYNKLQGYSAELEVYIDEKGYLKYKIVNPSNSKLFNDYIEEAMKRTISNLPAQLQPPKELIDYIDKGGKIIIEFRL
ncbi:MAG: TonB C-terminal domain-containing protein [Proteobacteria bacterium]|nr:TonB C-terminal domain-containing protein [Pseudomonadota bacterium]